MTREDLQELATLRLHEAQILLRQKSPSGAYYLAGYAVECALKACVAKSTQRFDFPDLHRVRNSWTHDLERLAAVAGLDQGLKNFRLQSSAFDRNWRTTVTWSEESRYRTWLISQAEVLLQAVADDVHGVLPWITTQW